MEHLFALANKLGPSLRDIDLREPSPAPTDPSEQDYNEKAEDAVDYEDIDEAYDGPEVETDTEEGHLLPKTEYFSSNALVALADNKTSVFDGENYDEDEESSKDNESAGENVVQTRRLEVISVGQLDLVPPDGGFTMDDIPPSSLQVDEHLDFRYEGFEPEEAVIEEEKIDSESGTSLPVLYIEDGNVILRFSEIFGVQELMRKARKDHQSTGDIL